mgnify:CR=1 FL=1|tara:strand:+ start:459 stop:1061 length:603 start_codon:yes stop_codon:yes gene_type:complete
MYINHAKAIQNYAKQSSNNLVDVITMVVLSIQQPWLSVGDQMADVKQNGLNSKFLWGNKRKAYTYITKRKDFIHNQYLAVINSKKSDNAKAYSLMNIFLRVEGLGMVKAGFVCQLSAGLVGCIDLHNIRLYGIDEKVLKLPKSLKTKELRDDRINKYISICHNIGTEKLWDTWCNYLSTKSPKWSDGFEVSKVHYDYLMR